MTGKPGLAGYRVLVAEDEYYIAMDTARALRDAGADIVGPCPTELVACAELAERSPDAAVVDINLGNRPSFKLAEMLKERGIPFIFVTGYDQDVIPPEFANVERLEKPVPPQRLVAAVTSLLASGTIEHFPSRSARE